MPIKYLNRNNNSTAISAGNSVLFNGTDQCLTVPSNAAFNFGTGDFTLEAWVYWTSTATSVGGQRIFLQGVAGTTEIGINYNATKFDIDINNLTRFSYTYAISTGQWYHIALVRRSTNVYELFVNGTSQGTNTYTYSQNANNFIIGGLTWASNYGTNGYISNVRILKGTALYTSSFSVPTAPLTAIANTSLLTCQSPTIVDNSTNNFTITNNGAATVSSTVPFTASFVSAPSVMKFTNRFNAETVLAGTQKAIFGYGYTTANVSITNLVSNTGVVATDTTGVGTARRLLAAAGYGTDKAIFGYGYITGAAVSMTNLVSNTGVVATDTTGVGTARYWLAAAGYGSDKAIFGYGDNDTTGNVSMTNLVSNTGVVATDTTGVGTARQQLAATGYGSDKAIFGYGITSVVVSMTNLVSNTGVVATDTTGVGTARVWLAAASYGSDKAIFGYGYTSAVVSMTNLVSNTGVVATDTTGVGTARQGLAAAGYGSDKAIFGYGYTTARVSTTNLVSNTGVVASNTTGVGTARQYLAAAGFSAGTIPAPSVMKFTNRFTDAVASIVTSGLVLNLDASNASSYPGSGTSWFDLSGNGNNGTLYNGPAFSNSSSSVISFDGGDDYFQANVNTAALDGDPSLSVDMFVRRRTGTNIGGGGELAGGSFWGIGGSGQGNSINGWTPTTNLIHLDIYDSTRLATSVYYPENQFVHICWTKNGAGVETTNVKCYINGVEVALTKNRSATRTNQFNTSTSGKGICLGRANADSSIFPAPIDIGTFKVYSRALSSNEVLQNYNANRARFGL